MKKYFKYIVLGMVVVSASSCKKYLDINDNPNSPTTTTIASIMPQAITGAAAISNNFNQSLADFGGFQANAGGFGGFGAVVTYDFGNTSYNGLWTSSYDNINDFEYIINNTSTDPVQAYSTGIARIMKSFGFERLVNQYNDVPYTEAFKGSLTLQPKYDKAPDVYKACIAELNKAMADITVAQADPLTAKISSSADPMFKGDMNLWKKFANTVKLRMLIKMAGVPAHSTYALPALAAINQTIGFVSDDVVNQPTYLKTEKPAPIYSSLGFSGSGAVVNTSRIPTKWIFSFYNGFKLADAFRGGVIYRSFPSTPTNQLGDESAGVPVALAAGSAWNTGTKETTDMIGVVKGPGQAQPVMIAAESHFLQAEARARGYIAGGGDATSFKAGMVASFNYLYKDVNNVLKTGKTPGADVDTYILDNATSPLVNYTLNTTTDQKVEAIITQKYIALNMISNDEAYNEFRRTGFPKIVNGSLIATDTFASAKSVSTHVDKLPTRILYPQQEYNLNPNNTPTGINKFSSLIFWDLN